MFASFDFDHCSFSLPLPSRIFIFSELPYHHIFPRDYLKKKGLTRGRYNQVANYVMTQSEINIAIGNKPPHQYFQEIFDQCNGGGLKYGGITHKEELLANLRMNCIPTDPALLTFENYNAFLEQRRLLMAQKIMTYYRSL